MKRFKLILCLYVLLQIASCFKANAQYSILTCGGKASGSGGSVENSIGLLFYKTQTGTNGSVSQGLQLPIEIYVISSLEDMKDDGFDISVFPNPANNFITVSFKNFIQKDMKLCIYDISGKILQEKNIENAETEIEISSFSNTIYILKIFDNTKVMRTYKIIKNK